MADIEHLDNKIAHIRLQPWFNPLTDAEVEIVASLLSKQEFAKDSVMVKEGEPVDSVYFIISGTVEVCKSQLVDHQMVRQVLVVMQSGAAIGLNETGFYSLSGMHTATVVTKTQVSCWRLSVAAFHGFALAYSHVSEVMRTNANIYVKN